MTPALWRVPCNAHAMHLIGSVIKSGLRGMGGALTIPAALCAWAGCWDAWHSWLPQLALSSSMANLPCFSPLSQGSPVHSPCCWVAVWTSAHHHCAPPFQLVG